MYSFAFLPSSVPFLTFSRSMSPVAMYGQLEVRTQAVRLRSLARARRPEQDQVEL